MLGTGSAVAISLLLASTEQSEPFRWSTVAETLQSLMPTWLWVVLSLSVVAFLVLIDIGDKLSGIFGSPFQRAQSTTDQLERTRQQLLKIVKKEVNLRLANSLHELVKLDLYMEDQRQRVGKSKIELVPEDTESSFPTINRTLRIKGNKTPLPLKFKKIMKVFERQDIQGKLLILGEPGSGKTTELLQLAQDLVARTEKDADQPVPVILELSSWNGESIGKWIVDQFQKRYDLSEGTIHQWLANYQILLLLDGLDELGLTKQRQCIEKINQFLETTHMPELVVCCRREEYEAGAIKLDSLNGAIYLESLKEVQIREYFEELNRLSLWKNIKGNPTLLELAQKPLFLFMLVVAYQGKPIRNEQELFDAYVEKQLHEPGNQGTYKSVKEPSPQKTIHYLIWLAKQLENIHETEFLIEGLQPDWLDVDRQSMLYRISVGLISGLFCWQIFWVISWLRSDLLDGLSFGLAFGLLVGLMIGLIDELGVLAIEPIEKVQWSFRGLQHGLKHELKHGLKIGLIFGIMLGGIAGLMSILTNLFIFMLIGGLLIGLAFGLISGLITSLISGLLNGFRNVVITEKDMPNQGIRKSIQNALRYGVLGGLFGGVMSGLLGGVMSGLSLGLVSGLISTMLGGLYVAIKHFVLRIFLTKYGYTPWNYARFLDHAVKHRFIQRTGGRYRFVHDLLRKHFAAMPLE
ncbi:NACHT domain-containing protein [Leptothoe kymatousa]|uniref:NACHT domain-containing protein n=1 Tax=Leptothoe kymatousa TAU-MAC 1615 TaxID=2364775 RepID=A0ABS5Y6F6_9CYAN|nr:NACHT domain-containing protein [Leptothoe kymatousa]MBT9312550.1 NACHT domain-containing protein [Leptothoe kymatousa TAU-MAC 1615]